MLKKAVFLTLAGALLASPAWAQDLDEVLNNYYEAIGGIDAWRALESTKATGTIMMGGMGVEAPFVVTAKRPNKVRIEFTFQGMTGVQAYDGETAWMLMPFMGRTDPEVMPEDMAKDILDEADNLLGGVEGVHLRLRDIGNLCTQYRFANVIRVHSSNTTSIDDDLSRRIVERREIIPHQA